MKSMTDLRELWAALFDDVDNPFLRSRRGLFTRQVTYKDGRGQRQKGWSQDFFYVE
jgi:hypothetical protein